MECYLNGKSSTELENVEWPLTWRRLERFLRDIGYKPPQAYYVCLSPAHKNKWTIRSSRDQPCSLCHAVDGAIPYYYLPLPDKIRRWCQDEDMCHKMTAHWRERNHWLHSALTAPKLKTEIWDGDRFAELSWFWDPTLR